MANDGFDIVVRGGTIVDGSGADPFKGDIGIKGDRIVAVGELAGTGKEEIDARDRIVTPGFVDIHTHYDGQATWDERMQPSSWHGVTTVVMGNCGIGFAPCRQKDQDLLMRLMEGVEDIPQPILAEGLPWNWESFPDYLDALEARHFDVDIGTQVPHSALRVYVMGERGANREPATKQDIARMRELTAEAIRAGAFGFSTSRAYTHKTRDGQPVPTMEAADDELVGLALSLKDAGAGVLQYVGNATIPALMEMMRQSGRPLSFTLAQANVDPDGWRAWVERMCEAKEQKLDMRGQVCGRPVGLIFGLDLTTNPFTLHPSYRPIDSLPLAEKVKRLSDPGFRARLLSEEPGPGDVFNNTSLTAFDRMYPMAEIPDYEPDDNASVAAIARNRGISPYEVILDHMLTNGGTGLLYAPIANYVSGNLDVALEMMRHPLTISGLSDGGAHVGMICDGSFPTTMLAHWTRDRTRGAKMSLPEAVKMQTSDTADWIGLNDRGRIAPGLRADLNVIDYDRLSLHAPEIWHDLPSGGRRLVQRAEGYDVTMVAGTVTYRNGVATGALPGRLVRASNRLQ